MILDMDTTNTCNRVFLKFLRIYCCEWNCKSTIFKKFQVCFITLMTSNVRRLDSLNPRLYESQIFLLDNHSNRQNSSVDSISFQSQNSVPQKLLFLWKY